MRRAVLETVGLGIAMAATLFGAAGSLSWPMAWLALAFYLAFSIAAFWVLPADLIAERSRLPAATSRSDLVIAAAASAFLLPLSLLVCGLDARFHGSPPLPSWVRALGMGGFAIGYSVSLWAAASNPFFAAVVRVQSERGHRVVDTGPYAIVRHPGYAGPIAGHLLLPLALGSLWGVLPAAIGSCLLALRIVHEERVLREGLPGYDEYAQRVRRRLVPGVW